MTIRSQRLDLVPMTAAFLRASLANERAKAKRLLGARLAEEWPEYPLLLEVRLSQLDAEPAIEPWLLRAIVLRSSRQMVSHIGFHEAPNPKHLRTISPGSAEFGFTVYEPFRRQGYAREASIALMDWARREQGVPRFILTIEPGNVASQALAAQLGFIRIGSHIDEVDGLEDILELRAANS